MRRTWSLASVTIVVLASVASPAPAAAATPQLTITDVSVTETNDPTNVNAVFTVRLSAASTRQVTVKYRTVNGPATGGAVAPTDYTAKAITTLTLPAQTRTRTVTVVVRGDRTDEVNETFTVVLSSPVNATIADASGKGTIIDNDPPPSLSIGDVVTFEPDAPATSSLVFRATLDRASAKLVTVAYATSDGTADSSDYTATSGVLTFNPMQTSKRITVPVTDDTEPEADETVQVTLSAPLKATILDGSAVGTIVANDADTSIRIADGGRIEFDPPGSFPMNFTVTLGSALDHEVTVDYKTRNDDITEHPATAGTDYQATSGTLTFDAGVTSQVIAVQVIADEEVESTESFTVWLTDSTGADIADFIGYGSITDDD